MKQNNELRMITITTFGYKDFTHNLLLSLERLNMDHKLHIYCLDQKSYAYFTDVIQHPDVHFHDNDLTVDYDQLQLFGTADFTDIVLYKFHVTHSLLAQGIDVLHVDGDIVFCKDPIQYLSDLLTDCDVVIQDNDNVEVNTGFALIKSNAKTIQEYVPALYLERSKHLPKGLDDDQEVFNKFMRENLSIKILPAPLFPSGCYFYPNSSNLGNEPYIVHFNCCMGSRKKEVMQKYGAWLVG